ncbi:dihydroxyacetone synthase-2 [Elsinoe australis]|uniref:Dihydroxyacetone synthase-2 n=1 Tax=Elsinoe australis TaxID=40998 RepID=A0A4U7B3D7_9PEZI|nr:dihydroxyacetone synthase-2 [Elsinoe australis]
MSSAKAVLKAGVNGTTMPLSNGDHGSGKADRLTDDEHAVLSLRNLLFDIIMQNGGGHGGSAIGMAAIGVALYKHTMRLNPSDPAWFDRDRFVLSNGHAAMFLYALNHLVGFDDWTMDELKGYGSAKVNGYTTKAHGHPEIEVPGVEVTTGPLGQGVANAVGLAIASKNLAARYNRPGYDIVQSRIYCMTGDGCLMEGVALEAIALAGHLQLDNLVLVYDNNQVTCDGPLDWINTEDINTKMRASGWYVLDIMEGSYDVQAIVSALTHSRSVKGKPVFINIRTVIGVGTANAGTAKAHHGAFDQESIAKSKIAGGLEPDSTHKVSERALSYFWERKSHGEQLQAEWDNLLGRFGDEHPDLHQDLQSRMNSRVAQTTLDVLDSLDSSDMKKLATRQASGQIMEKIWAGCDALIGGGADLANSNMIYQAKTDVFLPDNYAGRYVRYGIREHAMASVSNGIAAYHPGTFIPFTATFQIFYLYAAPGIRMGALSGLQAIHIATHDSFGEGQNGPTHQPVEVDSLYRAMPNLTFIRPCDAEELLGAWKYALTTTTRPTMISVGRDPNGPVPNTDRKQVLRGAYVIQEDPDATLTLASCGTCLHRAVAAAEQLKASGIRARIVSAPSLDLFAEQSKEYRESVFPLDDKPVVSVEEYVATTWARYVTASVSMTGFGYSASGPSNYRRFELDAEGIVKRVNSYLKSLNGRSARQMGWQQL